MTFNAVSLFYHYDLLFFPQGDGGPVQNGLAPVVSDDDPVHSKTQLLGADVGPEAYIELGKLPDEKTKEEEDSDRGMEEASFMILGPELTHWPLGDFDEILYKWFSFIHKWLSLAEVSMSLPSAGCHWDLLSALVQVMA